MHLYVGITKELKIIVDKITENNNILYTKGNFNDLRCIY